MYERFSELVISQLKKYLKKYRVDPRGEKWLISYYGDKALNKIFAKIIEFCNEQIQLDINGISYSFKVWNIDGKTIIPCLVKNNYGKEFEYLTPNYCTREFNGKLRDFFYFEDGRTVSNRILLTFVNEPIETQKASRILTAEKQPLYASNLIKGIEEEIKSKFSKKMQGVTSNVLTVWKDEIEVYKEDQIDEFLEVLHKTASEPTEQQQRVLGQLLPNLNLFLPVKGESEDAFSRKNLKENIELKKHFDNLFSPEILVEQEIEKIFKPAFAEKMIDAYRKNEQSLYQFPFEELKNNKLDNKMEDLGIKTIRFDESAILAKNEVYNKSSNYLIKVNPKSKSIKVFIELNRDLQGESLHTNTGTSRIKIVPERVLEKDSFQDNTVQFELNIEDIEMGHYGFCSIDLKSGTRSNSRSIWELKFAIVKAEKDQPVFYEQSFQIDTQYQAFLVSDDAICLLEKEDRHSLEILVVDDVTKPIKFEKSRKIVFQDIVQDEGKLVMAVPVWADAEYYLPLWLEPSSKEESVKEINSIYELLLNDRKKFIDQNGTQEWVRPDYKIEGDTIYFRGEKYTLGEKFAKYLLIEKELIHNPNILIWEEKNTADKKSVSLFEHSILKDLPRWDSEKYKQYLSCREEFFVKLQEKGIDSLLLTFIADDKDKELLTLAKNYISSYKQLCEEISKYNEPVKEEYQYVIYTDLIESFQNGSEILLVSPTHPLNVAYLIELGNKVRHWLDEDATNFVFGERDFQRLSTSNYIPLIQFKRKWYKVVESDYIAWNRYQLAEMNEEQEVESYVARVVSDKIIQFIEYHPVIFLPNREKSTMHINVFNPGDGKFIIDALREFFRNPKKREDTPKLHFNLIGNGKIGTLLDLTFSIDGVPEGFSQSSTEETLFQIIRERVSYTKQSNKESMPYAHITFVINQFHSSVRGEAYLNQFPASIYGEGLIPVISRKLKENENDDGTKTYLSALWINEEIENEEYGTMAYIARILQEQYHYLDSILNKYKAKMQMVDVRPSNLKGEMYKKSRWVVHLDREIGLEVFKRDLSSSQEQPIILDYSNQYNPQKAGYDVITTTLQVGPYINRIKRILNLENDQQAKKAISILNSLSGRWALNLVRNDDNNVAERIGNVITYQYLKEIERAFEVKDDYFTVIVSLEEFLRVNRKIGLPAKKGWIRDLGSRGQYSDDLVLITIYNSSAEEDLKVELRIIEVKFGSSDIKKGREQVLKTHDFFATRFAKKNLTDQMFRAMDFANLVLDGIDRAIMYEFLDKTHLSNIQFDKEIFPKLISNKFKIFMDGMFKGQRFKGDVVNISKDEQNFDTRILDGVRIITIPSKYFIPLLEEDEKSLLGLKSEYTVKLKDHSSFGLEPEVSFEDEQRADEEEVLNDLENEFNDPKEDKDLEVTDVDNDEKTMNSEVSFLIGKQVGTEINVDWDHRRNIPNPLANHNIVITGDPGKGKTQTIKGLIHEIRANNIPLLTFDFKDDYVDKEFLKAEKIELLDIIVEGLPFNPLIPSIDPNQGYFIAINQILQIEGIIKRIYNLGIQQATQFRQAIIEAFNRKGIAYNRPVHMDEVKEFPTFMDVHQILLEDEKKYSTLLGRIDLLFQLNLFRKNNKITFEQLMNGSYTLRLTRLPMNELKAAIAELVILAIHNYLLSKEQPRKLTRIVVLDEAHRVSESKALLELMREGRAFGIGMMIASQFPTDIPPDIYGCTETKLFLSNDQYSHAEFAAKQIEGGMSKQAIASLAEDIRRMKQFRAIMRNSQYPKVFVDVLPYYERSNE